jgi:hypothetical protein
MEGLTKALLNKALSNYNNELQKTPINHLQHDKIVTAYNKVIDAYDNLIKSITMLKQKKESFEQNHDSIMRTILVKNPELSDFSTSSIKSTKRQTKSTSSTKNTSSTNSTKRQTKRQTKTIGGYHTPSKRKTKRKRP